MMILRNLKKNPLYAPLFVALTLLTLQYNLPVTGKAPAHFLDQQKLNQNDLLVSSPTKLRFSCFTIYCFRAVLSSPVVLGPAWRNHCSIAGY